MWKLVDLFTVVFDFFKKVVPSDKMRENRQELREPKIKHNITDDIIDADFREMRGNVDITAAELVAVYHPDFTEDYAKAYIELLDDRVYRFRAKKPIRFKKWLRENPRL